MYNFLIIWRLSLTGEDPAFIEPVTTHPQKFAFRPKRKKSNPNPQLKINNKKCIRRLCLEQIVLLLLWSLPFSFQCSFVVYLLLECSSGNPASIFPVSKKLMRCSFITARCLCFWQRSAGVRRWHFHVNQNSAGKMECYKIIIITIAFDLFFKMACYLADWCVANNVEDMTPSIYLLQKIIITILSSPYTYPVVQYKLLRERCQSYPMMHYLY